MEGSAFKPCQPKEISKPTAIAVTKENMGTRHLSEEAPKQKRGQREQRLTGWFCYSLGGRAQLQLHVQLVR